MPEEFLVVFTAPIVQPDMETLNCLSAHRAKAARFAIAVELNLRVALNIGSVVSVTSQAL